MKAKMGDVIECCSCRAPIGNVLRDIPDGSQVIGDDIALSVATYGETGPLCGRCNGVAALHDEQGIGWTVQIAGRQVN